MVRFLSGVRVCLCVPQTLRLLPFPAAVRLLITSNTAATETSFRQYTGDNKRIETVIISGAVIFWDAHVCVIEKRIKNFLKVKSTKY